MDCWPGRCPTLGCVEKPTLLSELEAWEARGRREHEDLVRRDQLMRGDDRISATRRRQFSRILRAFFALTGLALFGALASASHWGFLAALGVFVISTIWIAIALAIFWFIMNPLEPPYSGPVGR